MLVFSLVLARSTSLDTACSAQPLRGPETHWFLDAVNAADQAQEALRLIDPFPRYARSEFGRGSPILSLDESAKFPRSRRRSHRPPKPHEVASSRSAPQCKPSARRGGISADSSAGPRCPIGCRIGGRTIRRYPRGLASEPSSMPAPTAPPTTPPTTPPRPPNRRSRAPNARIARWKSARVKSGQSTSVT